MMMRMLNVDANDDVDNDNDDGGGDDDGGDDDDDDDCDDDDLDENEFAWHSGVLFSGESYTEAKAMHLECVVAQ